MLTWFLLLEVLFNSELQPVSIIAQLRNLEHVSGGDEFKSFSTEFEGHFIESSFCLKYNNYSSCSEQVLPENAQSPRLVSDFSRWFSDVKPEGSGIYLSTNSYSELYTALRLPDKTVYVRVYQEALRDSLLDRTNFPRLENWRLVSGIDDLRNTADQVEKIIRFSENTAIPCSHTQADLNQGELEKFKQALINAFKMLEIMGEMSLILIHPLYKSLVENTKHYTQLALEYFYTGN